MNGTKVFMIFCKTYRKRYFNVFWDKIFEFIYLALPYVILATFTAYFTRLYAFRWREAMTFDYIPIGLLEELKSKDQLKEYKKIQ